MKLFYLMQNIGSSRYVVNFHDDIKKYPDGSEFYDMRIYSNKRNMLKFMKQLIKQGYVERAT